VTVVGIDISSRQINTAWLSPSGHPERWSQDLGKGDLIDRLQRIHIQWPDSPSEICIEYPYTPQRGAIAALMATVGIVTHQAPRYARVSWVKTADLRAAIGCRNTKQAAQEMILAHFEYLIGRGRPAPVLDWTDDDRDALVACIGWTRILEANE
jgi:hypothetical protein